MSEVAAYLIGSALVAAGAISASFGAGMMWRAWIAQGSKAPSVSYAAAIVICGVAFASVCILLKEGK